MMESTEEAMQHRLARLERTVRRWQVVGGVTMALLALVALIGAVERPAVEEVHEMRARAFVLIDRDGKPRMDLRVTPNDSTHLVLLDREGLPRMSLNILSQGGADVVLRDQLGLPRAALSVLPDGRPGLSLYDGAGTTRVSVGVSADAQARVVLYTPGGQVHWFTP